MYMDNGRLFMNDLLMELQTPLDVKTLEEKVQHLIRGLLRHGGAFSVTNGWSVLAGPLLNWRRERDCTALVDGVIVRPIYLTITFLPRLRSTLTSLSCIRRQDEISFYE